MLPLPKTILPDLKFKSGGGNGLSLNKIRLSSFLFFFM